MSNNQESALKIETVPFQGGTLNYKELYRDLMFFPGKFFGDRTKAMQREIKEERDNMINTLLDNNLSAQEVSNCLDMFQKCDTAGGKPKWEPEQRKRDIESTHKQSMFFQTSDMVPFERNTQAVNSLGRNPFSMNLFNESPLAGNHSNGNNFDGNYIVGNSDYVSDDLSPMEIYNMFKKKGL